MTLVFAQIKLMKQELAKKEKVEAEGQSQSELTKLLRCRGTCA